MIREEKKKLTHIANRLAQIQKQFDKRTANNMTELAVLEQLRNEIHILEQKTYDIAFSMHLTDNYEKAKQYQLIGHYQELKQLRAELKRRVLVMAAKDSTKTRSNKRKEPEYDFSQELDPVQIHSTNSYQQNQQRTPTNTQLTHPDIAAIVEQFQKQRSSNSN